MCCRCRVGVAFLRQVATPLTGWTALNDLRRGQCMAERTGPLRAMVKQHPILRVSQPGMGTSRRSPPELVAPSQPLKP